MKPVLAIVTAAVALMAGPAAHAQQWRGVMLDPERIIRPDLLSLALKAYERHADERLSRERMAIVDFSKPSSERRMFVVDLKTGLVSSFLVAHGRGSDPGHTGFLHHFSNAFGSEASSNGAYVTSEYYYGKYGRSMRVRGLDHSNSNAEARAIVVHTAWYAEPNVVAETGRLGRSEGCFALPNRSLQEVLARLGPGRFLYADKLV